MDRWTAWDWWVLTSMVFMLLGLFVFVWVLVYPEDRTGVGFLTIFSALCYALAGFLIAIRCPRWLCEKQIS